MRMRRCWCAILGHNHTIWCLKKIYQNNFSSAICMSSARFAKSVTCRMASSFFRPKVTSLCHHTRHRWTGPDVGREFVQKIPALKGTLGLHFFGGHISSENKKEILGISYSKIKSVMYGRSDQNHFTRLWDTKNTTGNLWKCTQVTWSVSRHLPGAPSPRQWRSNDNEGPSW